MPEDDQVIFTSLSEKRGDVDSVLRHFVEIHNRGKELFLLAEEVDSDGFNDFLQPVLELRHALEHVARGLYHRLSVGYEKESDFDYVRRCYEKALGHEYRSFFDSADWISVRYRELIIEKLRPFTPDCIKEVIPEWYSQLRPRIDSINREIAAIRSDKDISRGHTVLDEVKNYEGIIGELGRIHDRVRDAVPTLIDLQTRRKAEEHAVEGKTRRELFVNGIVALAAAALGAFLTWLLM